MEWVKTVGPTLFLEFLKQLPSDLWFLKEKKNRQLRRL